MTQNIETKQKPDKSELGKKPFWYLFLLANVIVVIGCAVTFALIYKQTDTKKELLVLPTAICNVVAVIPAGFFIWLELKDISPKVMHFQKKWLKFYIVSASFFVATILFNALFFIIASKYESAYSTKRWMWIIYLVISLVLSLISIAFQRYARYRIDLDVYRRRHGEEIKDNEPKKPEEAKSEKPVEPSDVKTPTGGLLDQMDK